MSESGFYVQRHRPPSARAIRHAALTDVITRVHADSRGTYGGRRVHAELVLGHGLVVGHGTVALLMRRAGLAGVFGPPRFRRVGGVATASDLVERQFGHDDRDRLWVTDITKHPTREGGDAPCAAQKESKVESSAWRGAIERKPHDRRQRSLAG